MAALTRISKHCWVTTSSFCAMNTVVVCGSGGAVVIDPGVTGDELDELVADSVSAGLNYQALSESLSRHLGLMRLAISGRSGA